LAIKRFIWTEHAELRLGQRGLTKADVEDAVREGHEDRQINQGDADWRVEGVRADGREFAVIYDNPVRGDASAARVVSIWPLREGRRR
jgi:uncharacterized protein DUF4258